MSAEALGAKAEGKRSSSGLPGINTPFLQYWIESSPASHDDVFMKPLDVLVVSDLHYRSERDAGAHSALRAEFGVVLLRKCLNRLNHLGVKPGLLLVLGDVVDDGLNEDTRRHFAEVSEAVKKMGLRTLFVHGNHDGDVERFESAFNSPGFHEVDGFGFVIFNDAVAAGEVTTRKASDVELLNRVVAEHPGMPLVALQHNPVYPHVDSSEYPYMLTNADEVLADYVKKGVMLSLSGHSHAGQPPCKIQSLTTYTVPTLCEPPFAFAHVRLDEHGVEIKEHRLKMDVPGLADVHCHTEYAYCGTSVSAAKCLAVSELLGVGSVCVTEHSFQLYFERDEAWSFRWQTDAAMVQEAWCKRSGRMDEYKKFAGTLRCDTVKLGLEVDLCSDGRVLLAPEDEAGWDVLVGAIHVIPGYVKGKTSQAEAEEMFLEETRRMIANPINVLAHPFRFFLRGGLHIPKHLYATVAEMLAAKNVAAEVNFHIYVPDPLFVKECVKRGVKIALGSDGHDIVETGELVPHLRVLEEAGVKQADFATVLYRF